MTREALMFLSGIRGNIIRKAVDAVRPVIYESNLDHIERLDQDSTIGLAAWYNKVVSGGYGNVYFLLKELQAYDMASAHLLEESIGNDSEWIDGGRDFLCVTTLTASFAKCPDKLLNYKWTKASLVEFKMAVIYAIFTELCPRDKLFLDLESMLNYYADQI